jgi:hypothetical protein
MVLLSNVREVDIPNAGLVNKADDELSVSNPACTLA